MTAGPPCSPVDLPAPVAAVAGELATHVVWQNVLGGLTFEVGSGGERFFVKWAPKASGVDLSQEAARLRWAIAFTPVARVLDERADESGSLARLYSPAG